MYRFIRSILFLFDAEKVHYFTMNTLSSIMKIPGVKSAISYFYKSEQTICPVTVMGLSFVNPVGIAAGFDKDGKYFKPLSALGFGFIEIGTVTPLPQSGNTKPRLFRLKKDAAIINRMGFNNDGVDALVNRLKERKNSKIIIGGNIGKNKITPNDKAEQDYLICLEKLYPYVDYFVVNVSSPNTEGLRELQDKKPLLNLLTQLQNKAKQYNKLKPILLKIAPDLNNDQLDDIAQIINETDIEGVIATNTTVAREDLKTDKAIIQEIGNGGLSGKPLKERSTEVIRYLRKRLQENKTIIGVGGIHSEVDAQEKIEAGANLVQLYTGFIYEGPALIQRISKKIKHA